MIIIIKLFDRGVKCNYISILTLFSNIFIVLFFMTSFFKFNKNLNEFTHEDMLSTIFLGIFILINTTYIDIFKIITSRKNYLHICKI